MSADGECRREFEKWAQTSGVSLYNKSYNDGAWVAWQAAWGRAGASTDSEDAKRFRWWFGQESRCMELPDCGDDDFITVDKWRAVIDAALKAGGV